MKEKIFFISHASELNGAERMLADLLERINRNKYDPVLVIPQPGPLGERLSRSGIATLVIPMKWWLTGRKEILLQPFKWLWNIWGVLKLVSFLKKEGTRLVVSNSIVNFSGALAARVCGLPHVWIIHEIVGRKSDGLCFILGVSQLKNLIRKFSSQVVANSVATWKAMGHQAERIIVYNGVDFSLLPLISTLQAREKMGFSFNDKVVGVIGKVCPEKGQMKALVAVEKLSTEFPSLKIAFCGQIKDFHYYKRILQKAGKLGWGEKIYFLGYQKDVFLFLKTLDVLLVTSSHESFGRSVIEAMASRTPVVAVKSGGIPEIVEHGKNGLLVGRPNPEEISKALSGILRHSQYACFLAENGFRTVEKKFQLSAQVEKIEQILDSNLKRSSLG